MRRTIAIGAIILAAFPLTIASAQTGAKAVDKIAPAQVPPVASTTEHDLAEEREARREAEHRASIAEAKADLVDAAGSRLENWIAFYGLLIAFVAIFAGWATRNQAKKAREQAQAAANSAGEQAAQAAKLEMLDFRQEAESIMKKLRDNHGEAVQLTESLKQKVDAPPTSDQTNEATTTEKLELKELAAQIAGKPKSEWTAEDYRVLLFDAALRKDWKRYVELAKGMAWTYDASPEDLGFALFAIGFGQYKLGNLEQAASAYQDYLTRCPADPAIDRAAALSNWGNTLNNQAKAKQAEGDSAETDRLWTLAYEKFQAALVIKPDTHQALFNWGNALDDQAQAKQVAGASAEADRLWALADEKYQAALAIKPDKHEALNNWGSALANQARAKQVAGASAESGRLWAVAGEKYQAALAIKPDKYEALCNWSSALTTQAHSQSGSRRNELLDQAEKLLRRANEILPGAGNYNLACVAALRGDTTGAAQWLRDAKTNDRDCPDCSHIHADSDFDRVRGSEEFQQALIDIGCAPPKDTPDNAG